MTNCRRINALMTGVLLVGSIAGIATLDADALGAEEASVTLSPKALEEIGQVETEIDRIEAQTLERLVPPPDNQVQQIELLGKALLYDKNLSVNRNQACAFCHMPETGFTGPISELNRTTGSYPGSVRTRFSQRTPQTHAYAPLAPVLHYNPGQGDLVGGNFWDMRATGRRLGNPAAEQAEGPPTNPVEMGLPDLACAVYRVSQRPIGRCSSTSGACRPSPLLGRATSKWCATNRGRLPPANPCRCISARLIAAAPRQPTIRWRNRSPDTNPLQRCRPSRRNSMRCSPARLSSPPRSS
jgi:hypothetical protein